MQNDKANYWDSYYKNNKISSPSQFGAFCLNEFPEHYKIVDCGCGDGRDSLFFAKYGRHVIGLDQSHEAIELCQKRAEKNHLYSIEFQQVNFQDINRVEQIIDTLSTENSGVVIYARFFIHAIDDLTENNFFNFCFTICKQHQGKLFFEFRTSKDQEIKKNFGQHFRRYVDLDTIAQRLSKLGFEIEYSVEGVGFAKFKSEDAFVARLIAGIPQ